MPGNARVKLFSLWFYTAAVLYSALVIPLLTLAVAVARPWIGRKRALWLFRRFIAVWGRGIVAVLPYPFVRVRYRDFSGGTERGPFLFVCNHRSASDPFLLSLLPGTGIQVVNIWPFRIPVLGRFARWAGYLNVRQMPFAAFKERVRAVLADGFNVGAFPEGTRSTSRRMGPFHGAVFRAGLECGATLVPVCLMGTEDKPRKGSPWVCPGVIRMHRLPGIPFAQYRGQTPYAFKQNVRRRIAAHLRTHEGDDGNETDSGL